MEAWEKDVGEEMENETESGQLRKEKEPSHDGLCKRSALINRLDTTICFSRQVCASTYCTVVRAREVDKYWDADGILQSRLILDMV